MRDYAFDASSYRDEIQRLSEDGRKTVEVEAEKYSFVPRENDLYFRGKIREAELKRIWDNAPNSVLAPWRTRYEPGDPRLEAHRPEHLTMQDPTEILRRERRRAPLWQQLVLSPFYIIASIVIVAAMILVWTAHGVSRLVRAWKSRV